MAEYHTLSQVDRILHLVGAPMSQLKRKFDPTKLAFETVVHNHSEAASAAKPISLTPARQQEVYKGIRDNAQGLVHSAPLIVIASNPTDQSAYQLAITLARSYVQDKLTRMQLPKLKWIDLGAPDWNYLRANATTESRMVNENDMVVIHGVTDQSDGKRMELARDFIRATEGRTCLVLGAHRNVLNMAFDALKISPDLVFQVGRTVDRKIV